MSLLFHVLQVFDALPPAEQADLKNRSMCAVMLEHGVLRRALITLNSSLVSRYNQFYVDASHRKEATGGVAVGEVSASIRLYHFHCTCVLRCAYRFTWCLLL